MSRKILIEKIEETTKVSIWDTKTPDKKRYYYYNLGANISLENNNKTIIVDDLNVHPYPRLMFNFEDLDDNLGATDAITYADAMASNLFFLVSGGGSSAAPTSDDELISVGSIDVTGNDVTIDGVVGEINNNVLTVGTTTLPIPFAAPGYERIDFIVLNALGDLEVITGPESNTGIVVSPTLLPDTLLVTQLDVDDSAIEFTEPIVVVPGTYKTYFVNSVTGDNATGIYQDPSKPFSTVDYVFALPTWKDGDTIYLQNHEGTFPINGVFPKGTSKIVSDLKVNLDFSANNNASVVTSDGGIYTAIHLLIPNGIIRNERSGGAGCVFMEDNQKLFMEVKAKELYYNTSTDFAKPSGYDIYIPKITVKARFLEIGGVLFGYQLAPIHVNEFICLGVGARIVSTLPMGTPISINKISGAGSFYFSSAYYNIGDIATTAQSLCSDNGNPIVINFKNSVITTATGLELCNYYGGSIVITGIVKSATKINFLISEGAGNNLRVVNFSGDIGTGVFTCSQGGTMGITVENSFVKSATTPFAFYTGFGNSGITLRNSAFQMTTPGPLVTGGTGDTRTITVSGVSHNGTMYSDAEGVGVTVTSETIHGNIRLPKYTSSRNDGVTPNNKLLNVDASGNLMLCTQATMPAPYLEDLIPDSNLPSTSGIFILKGSFFTPTMTVDIVGQTINSIDFISDNEVRVNITTGATEGTFDVTLNNGLSVTFPDVLLITLGDVYIPVESDYTDVVDPIDLTEDGEVLLEVAGSTGSAKLDLPFDRLNEFSIYFEYKISPLQPSPAFGTYDNGIRITDSVTGDYHDLKISWFGSSNEFRLYKNGVYVDLLGWHPAPLRANMRMFWNGTQFFIYRDGILAYTIGSSEFPNDVLVSFFVTHFDLKNIKYVIHP